MWRQESEEIYIEQGYPEKSGGELLECLRMNRRAKDSLLETNHVFPVNAAFV